MPQATYTCSFSSELNFSSHPSASLSGPSSQIPENSVVTDITFKVYCGVGTFNYDADCNMTLTDGGGASTTIYSRCYTGNANRLWAEFGDRPDDDLDWNSLSSIQLSGTNKLTVRTGYTATLTITYDTIGSCTAPTTVKLSSTTVDAGATATLSWSGATAGNRNPIKGYVVYRSTSADSGYSALKSVGAGTLSLAVTAPGTMGQKYYYKVATVDTMDGAEIMSKVYAPLTARTYTACTAPTKVTASAESVAPGTKVTLSWSGAKAGENSPITGYQVYRSTKESEGYSLLTTVASTATSGSTTVVAPTTNGATYYYKVLTLCEKSAYNSAQSVAVASVACAFAAVSAPTTLKVSVTNVAPGAKATLSWSGAAAGENNAIAGYKVYRATSVDGTYTLLTTVTTTGTTGSTEVTAPTSSGVTYYYKVQTLGATGGYDSELSSSYTALTCTYSSPNAPTQVTVNGKVEVYAKPGAVVDLAWSGASAGANNAITGYDIYRNGELYVSGLAPTVSSRSVPAHSTAGSAYTYSIVTRGTYSNSAASAACRVYAYTDPTAPTTVSVSDENPPAGVRVTLSWSGATPGGYNAIKSYRVYRSTAVNGVVALVATVASESGAASCYVDAPSRAGYKYFYRVETVGEYSSSGASSVYATVTASEDSSASDGEVKVVVTPKKPRAKRGFIFGEYDTALDGKWTLTGWAFSEPETQTHYAEVPGRSAGPLDMTAVLTDGDPRYGSRALEATFESSEGTRMDREWVISAMTNLLHGRRVKIVFPDDKTRYAVGRLSVHKEYNDTVHAALSVSAVCEPWLYSKQETRVELLVAETPRNVVLSNRGRRVIVPEVTVSGYKASVELVCAGLSWTLGEGTHRLPDMLLPTGNTLMTYSGNGTVSINYREAIL